jgi:hypothetical protein
MRNARDADMYMTLLCKKCAKRRKKIGVHE